jgi:hypothetical protein
MAMKAGQIRISAAVSQSTKDMLDAIVKSRGLRKGYLVEEALSHHLLALQELPDEVIIPSRIVLTKESFKEMAGEIDKPSPPTLALRKLMSKRRGH